ncbi:MAG: hypothetical protein U1F41_04145 [Burkholderiales bacterium]
MVETATATADGSTKRLRKDPAGDLHWQPLPGADPIASQQAACESVARLLRAGALDPGQLPVLLALDLRARPIGARLLRRYVEGDPQLQVFHRRDWSAALRLTQSFLGAYQHFWRHIRGAAGEDAIPHAHLVVCQILHHRGVELLLRFMRYKKRVPAHWEEIHGLYKFARERGVAGREVDPRPAQVKPAEAMTPEQGYVRLLLLDLLNNGQFSPREGLWLDALLGRWCRALRLRSREENEAIEPGQAGFAVNPDGTEGLRRGLPATAGNALFLDTSPLMALIEQEFEANREADPRLGELAFATRAGRIALLEKVAVIVDPNPVRVQRRGERTQIAAMVEGISGFADIVQVLREEGRTDSRATPAEGITISPLGAERYASPLPAGAGIDPSPAPGAGTRVVAPRAWQVKDRSDSGCRMRGQIEDLNRLVPGALILTRESAHAPWTVSVVRRFRRLMVDYVEIGVEDLGRRPRFVKLVLDGTNGADRADGADVEALGDAGKRCFAALYLPPSEERPRMPIKTILLPARCFRAGATVTLLSANANYTLRLNQPIHQQYEFVCVPFTVLHKRPAQPA